MDIPFDHIYSHVIYGGFLKWGYPKSGNSIMNHPFFGYPHSWKPPYLSLYIDR